MGYLFAILSAILASLTHSISKPLLENTDSVAGVEPLVLAAIIYLISGFFFTPFRKNNTPIQNLGRKNLILLSLIGITEVIAMVVSFVGITNTTAVNASIFINAEILFSILIAVIVFNERLQSKEVPPFALIVLSVIVLPIGYDFYKNGMLFSNLVMGDLLIILGGLFFSISNIISKYVSSNISAKRITQISSFAAAGFGISILVSLNIPFEIKISQLPGILVMGILDVGLATLLFVLALRIIGAIKTILIFSSATVFGVIFANILLNETITMLNLMSMLIMFIGMYWLRNKFAEEDTSFNNNHAFY